jgi:hypothetical protein
MKEMVIDYQNRYHFIEMAKYNLSCSMSMKMKMSRMNPRSFEKQN